MCCSPRGLRCARFDRARRRSTVTKHSDLRQVLAPALI